MLTKNRFAKISLDVFPRFESRQFFEFSCAVAQVYIAPNEITDIDIILRHIEESLFVEGWKMATVLGVTQLSEEELPMSGSSVREESYIFDMQRIEIETILANQSIELETLPDEKRFGVLGQAELVQS